MTTGASLTPLPCGEGRGEGGRARPGARSREVKPDGRPSPTLSRKGRGGKTSRVPERLTTHPTVAGSGNVPSQALSTPAIWDLLSCEGKRSIIIGVPPGYPPRAINGVSVGCFLTPDTASDVFTHPAELSDEIRRLVGYYPVDVKGLRTEDKSGLRDQIFAMSRIQFRVARHLLQTQPWDYFQFVDIGVDRVQHEFWKDHDPLHVLHDPGSPFRDTIHQYYRHLDEEIGRVLELLSDETIVLIVSDHGAQRLDVGFCVNEWLVREGLLVLNRYPEAITPFADLDVNWDKTRAWSEGGDVARIYLNVKGREPRGVIDPADAGRFRDELKARLEATVDLGGKPLGTVAFKPEETYLHVRSVAPDLIVHLGGLSWRATDGVGYPSLHALGNDAGPDDCNPAQFGAFILAAPNSPLSGEVHNARLLDIAPTLLELGGYEIPSSMQGQSLVPGTHVPPPVANEDDIEAERLVRERLSGLGYI